MSNERTPLKVTIQDHKSFYTAYLDTPAGRVAALPLPVATERNNSPGKIEINSVSGYVRPNSAQYIKDSTRLEIVHPGYRTAAWDNATTLKNLDCNPAALFGLTNALLTWMYAVETDHIKLFLGGDLENVDQFDCVCAAAKRVPDKKIFMLSGNVEMLNDALLHNITIPSNLTIVHEYQPYAGLYLADHPTCVFSDCPDNGTDLDYFPTQGRPPAKFHASKVEIQALAQNPVWWASALRA